MFPLYEQRLPQTVDGLARTLKGSLQRALQIPGNPVLVRETRYPDLAEIAIDLSGAKVRPNPPRLTPPAGSGVPAITVQHFALKAEPLSIGDAALDLRIVANGLVLHRNGDEEGNLFLQLQRADTGRIVVAMTQRNLEILVDQIAKKEAGKQGVAIEQMELRLTSRGPRSLGAEVRVQARKLFMRAVIRLAGVLKIDEQLVARASGLTCSGDGPLAAIACGFFTPHLQALQNREFPLLALPLGGIQLRDIYVNVGDGIEVGAEFGTAAV